MNDTTTKVTAANVKIKTVKKVLSNAAVVPLVNTKTKQVFIKVVKGNADKSIEATSKAIENKKLDSFEGAARAFVKSNGFTNLTLWTSRVAKVQPSRVTKSAANQIAFWKKNGFTIVNEADFPAAEVAVKAVVVETIKAANGEIPNAV